MADYRCGEVTIDTGGRRLLRSGHDVALEPRTLAVILELLVRPGTLVTRNQLLDAVWGHRHLTRSALNRVISCARRAFGDDVGQPRYIATVHGTGYRYIGPAPVAASLSSTEGLGRVWYWDLALMEQRAERLLALAGLLGISLATESETPDEPPLPEHIIIRIQRPPQVV
ncbi:MAG TPA: winged helix-turn-helix domain-containing protein [Steroidobacteraceae bacterium]|jgi:DNA-binding winged helix-turn-helix (wHTH) protein